MQQQEQKSWKLAVRVNYHGESIFKTKRIAPDRFLMHLPAQKTVQTFDMALNTQDKTYRFEAEMNAIDQLQLNNGTYVVAGSKDGQIQLQHTNQTQKYTLTPNVLIQRDKRYINDFVSCANSRLVNCYNNGAIAVWNLNQQLSNDIKPTSYNIIHDSFFYKMRKIDQSTILTASNDFTAKIFDLQAATVLDTFHHVSSVWCAYPLNQRVFCTSGLMNSIVFWDSRSHRIINKCSLRNQQTSFVTRYDDNNVIFGDGNQIALCDLRKPIKTAFTQHLMTVSAETILVGDNEVIVAGRGGDVCLLRHGGSQIQAEQRNVGNSTLSPMMRFFQMMRLNMNNQLRLFNNNQEEQDFDDEEDEVDQDFDQEELDALEEEYMREHLQSDQEEDILIMNPREDQNQNQSQQQPLNLIFEEAVQKRQEPMDQQKGMVEQMAMQQVDKVKYSDKVGQVEVQKQQINQNKQQQQQIIPQQSLSSQQQQFIQPPQSADKK